MPPRVVGRLTETPKEPLDHGARVIRGERVAIDLPVEREPLSIDFQLLDVPGGLERERAGLSRRQVEDDLHVACELRTREQLARGAVDAPDAAILVQEDDETVVSREPDRIEQALGEEHGAHGRREAPHPVEQDAEGNPKECEEQPDERDRVPEASSRAERLIDQGLESAGVQG